MKEMALNSLTFNSLIATKSTKFLLPFILSSKSYISKRDTNFVNAYIGDVNRPWLEDKIFLVYKAPLTLNSVRKGLEQNKYFYSNYWITINSESYEVYTFNIPFEYKKVINLIKDGYVTSIDVSSKKKILDFWSRNEYSIYSELYKDNLSLLDQQDLYNDLIKEEDIVLSPLEEMLMVA